jgi:PIN domain nuclease of toxin-antitoxin system
VIALDASALLCFMFQEPGSEMVSEYIAESCLSTVNLSEVLGRFTRDGHDAAIVVERIRSTAIQIIPFDEVQATIAASLQPVTQPQGLSLGDRACLSLAFSKEIPALTADKIWQSLDLQIEVVSVR